MDMQKVWEGIKRFWKSEEGLGTLELLLILAVLVIIAFAFRKWIMKWVGDLFKSTDQKITETSNSTDNIMPSP